MTFLTVSAVVASAIIVGCCFYLVWSEKYEDGLLGRIALSGLGVNCLVFALDAIFGSAHYELLPTTALTVVFIALFLLRHSYRFHKWSRSGAGDWRKKGES